MAIKLGNLVKGIGQGVANSVKTAVQVVAKPAEAKQTFAAFQAESTRNFQEMTGKQLSTKDTAFATSLTNSVASVAASNPAALKNVGGLAQMSLTAAKESYVMPTVQPVAPIAPVQPVATPVQIQAPQMLPQTIGVSLGQTIPVSNLIGANAPKTLPGGQEIPADPKDKYKTPEPEPVKPSLWDRMKAWFINNRELGYTIMVAVPVAIVAVIYFVFKGKKSSRKGWRR